MGILSFMGFWILMAMLVCAVATVVVALAIERPTAPQPASRHSDDALRWLAVVPAGTSAGQDHWASRLAGILPDSVVPEVIEAPGATLAELRPTAMDAIRTRPPDVLLVWSALDDVLAGVPLEEHEIALHGLLEELGERDVTAVVGNVPDLSRLPAAVGAGLPAEELRLLTERWNGAIGRLAHHHGALVVDLFDLPAPTRSAIAGAADQAAIADRFLPVLRQALVGARRRRLAASEAEPV